MFKSQCSKSDFLNILPPKRYIERIKHLGKIFKISYERMTHRTKKKDISEADDVGIWG